MTSYLAALKEGGILSVTLWNKEDPPKSILKLYATMVEAAGGSNAAHSFYAVSSYLSTTTVLYKRGGFSEDDIARLSTFTKSLSFDEIYFPGMIFDEKQTDKLLADYTALVFGAPVDATLPTSTDGDVLAPLPDGDALAGSTPIVVPATKLERLVWHYLTMGKFDEIARRYVFDIRPLSNDHPYFAAYIKPSDLGRITDRLDLFQDDWAYLLLWATLGIASTLSIFLVALPAIFGWRSIFAKTPGKSGIIVYFACLGFGYIMTEVGLISKFVLALANPTISALTLLSGILVFSGLGSMVSERFIDNARVILPRVLIVISSLLLVASMFADPVLDWIGGLAYGWRLALCILAVAPTAFLMGFPMPIAMTTLGRLGRQSMFLWAWGINGCTSVIGAALVPVLATGFGIGSVLQVSAAAYFLAIPCFLMLTKTGLRTTEA